jgi:hypothetical protein
VTRLWVGRSGVRIPEGVRHFLFSKSADRLWGPPSPLFKGCPSSFQEVKRPGREVDNSPPSTAVIKDGWSYTSSVPV